MAKTAGPPGQVQPPATTARTQIGDDQVLTEDHRRRLRIVGHGACHPVQAWSFVISGHFGAAGRGQSVQDISDSPAGMGWLLLSYPHQVTVAGQASVAVLVNPGLPGQGRTHRLAAPPGVQATGGRLTEPALPGRPNRRPRPGRPVSPDAVPIMASGTRDRVGTWVADGSAGNDVSG